MVRRARHNAWHDGCLSRILARPNVLRATDFAKEIVRRARRHAWHDALHATEFAAFDARRA